MTGKFPNKRKGHPDPGLMFFSLLENGYAICGSRSEVWERNDGSKVQLWWGVLISLFKRVVNAYAYSNEQKKLFKVFLSLETFLWYQNKLFVTNACPIVKIKWNSSEMKNICNLLYNCMWCAISPVSSVWMWVFNWHIPTGSKYVNLNWTNKGKNIFVIFYLIPW